MKLKSFLIALALLVVAPVYGEHLDAHVEHDAHSAEFSVDAEDAENIGTRLKVYECTAVHARFPGCGGHHATGYFPRIVQKRAYNQCVSHGGPCYSVGCRRIR